MILKILKWLPPYTCTVVVTLAILYLTLWPDPVPDHPRLFEGADKVVHAIMFMGFYWALGLDLALNRKEGVPASGQCDIPARSSAPRVTAGIIIVTAAFGALVEILQWWMGIGRSGDTLDFVADVAGALIGALTLNPLLRCLGIR